MIKFPYGNSDFYDIITGKYFYVDRTGKIALLEEVGKTLLFLRPRRFGKSLWLSVLENYYDLRKADEFERLFGNLAIGQNPTPLHNQYLILKWNFSKIENSEDETGMRQAVHNHLNDRIWEFMLTYQDILPVRLETNPHDALSGLDRLLAIVRTTPYKIYLLIDEYDNFANEILMGGLPRSEQRYERLIRGEGLLKTVFKAVKDGTEGRGIDRVFITGVSPVVLSDVTSGFNIAENIYLLPEFNDLCGFWETEVAEVLQQVAGHCDFSSQQAAEALKMMQTYYNGYKFTSKAEALIYNPTLVLYFLKRFQSQCDYPEEMLDDNLAMDRGKINYIAQLPDGESLIWQALNRQQPLTAQRLAYRFGIREMLYGPKDTRFMLSLLYYFGVLTLARERTEYGELMFQIPNLVVQGLYAERIQEMLLPSARDIDESRRVTRLLYQKGEMAPLGEFIEQKHLTVFDNRDYREADELTVKTVFLTLLFNDTFYIMDSEPALQRRYGDLTMLVRPDMRHSALLDILIEFKYVPLGKNKLTGEKVRKMTREELLGLNPVKAGLAEAEKQLADYRATLDKVYGAGFLKLRTYTVISVGYDRLVWAEH